MKIILADNRGFCPGVRRAVQKALESLDEYGTVYSLGHLIHNRQVVDDLIRRGLKVVEDIADVPEHSAVLIRSHGVSPAVLQRAKERRLTVIDATCGLVRRAQELVARLSREGYHVVVIGDANHPEVRGLIGYGEKVTVAAGPEDVAQLPRLARLGVVAQTTISPARVAEVVGLLIRHGFSEMKILNTLCDQSIARQQSATRLAGEVDVMFVLGGLDSANTRHLAQLCREAGVQTHHLEHFGQFEPAMIAGANQVGITAGASTPDRLIEEFVTKVEEVAQTTT
ncbi:MAG: 4-hydroxy-3-methylbut-2-enyl diphosphate reductase [Phycisphaerae bacterium]|nr:4-hydroxy-3-methylbut-2-enyl diphosphate reductase [Phycisphaerae bacterium]